uniref:Stage VI sporulation protein D n=1 Tax=Candidatus Kentrum sp. FM TaxID=2126340 RepID=A0A450TAK6_9GAMM|nr:MAG: stage VI sporulation protein D [Candidatus Kentron sp. FM]VFJ65470.1 MAG: stage VI sporulation protein D [Candidatus Kentron sp. FM]VFK15796.1 MAG: stage VI sporulation protein D [Candidatus Kentron sp. FM]
MSDDSISTQLNSQEIDKLITILQKLKPENTQDTHTRNKKEEGKNDSRSSGKERAFNFSINLVSAIVFFVLMTVAIFITTQFILMKIQPHSVSKLETTQQEDQDLALKVVENGGDLKDYIAKLQRDVNTLKSQLEEYQRNNRVQVEELNKTQAPSEEAIPVIDKISTGEGGELESLKRSRIYIVKSGDSLSKIAQKYGISWQKLWKANQLAIPDQTKLEPGQKLIIPNQ